MSDFREQSMYAPNQLVMAIIGRHAYRIWQLENDKLAEDMADYGAAHSRIMEERFEDNIIVRPTASTDELTGVTTDQHVVLSALRRHYSTSPVLDEADLVRDAMEDAARDLHQQELVLAARLNSMRAAYPFHWDLWRYVAADTEEAPGIN